MNNAALNSEVLTKAILLVQKNFSPALGLQIKEIHADLYKPTSLEKSRGKCTWINWCRLHDKQGNCTWLSKIVYFVKNTTLVQETVKNGGFSEDHMRHERSPTIKYESVLFHHHPAFLCHV